MSHNADVAIIGAGIVGCCTAWRLAREGLRVALLDCGAVAGGATGAATGILPRPNRADGPFANLCRAGFDEWAGFADELADAVGEHVSIKAGPGGLHLIENASDIPAARRAFETEITRGVPAEWWTPGDLHRAEPALAGDLAAAIRYPEYRAASPAEVCRLLVQDIAARGGKLLLGQAVTAVTFEPRAFGIDASGERVSAGTVVAALGAWASQPPTGVAPLPVEPVRGQALQLRARPGIVRHILHCVDFHLVPRADGTLVVGATTESVGFDCRVTGAGVAGLLEQAVRWVPELAGAEFLGAWAGLRPKSRKRLPFIGPVPGAPGFFAAAGHYKSGILLGPITGRIIADLVMGRRPAVDTEPFRVER